MNCQPQHSVKVNFGEVNFSEMGLWPCQMWTVKSSWTENMIFPTERSPNLESTTEHETPTLIFGDSATSESPKSDSSAPSVPKRQCSAFQIDFCRQLPYNLTTFPNAMGHRSIDEAKNDIERFKWVRPLGLILKMSQRVLLEVDASNSKQIFCRWRVNRPLQFKLPTKMKWYQHLSKYKIFHLLSKFNYVINGLLTIIAR